jgi:hypothetical protein
MYISRNKFIASEKWLFACFAMQKQRRKKNLRRCLRNTCYCIQPGAGAGLAGAEGSSARKDFVPVTVLDQRAPSGPS